MRKFDVWYRKDGDIKDRSDFSRPFVETHEKVAIVYSDNLNDVFHHMNGMDRRFPNPLESSNAQEYLKSNSEVCHTSMSVGDVVYDNEDECWYGVDPVGWRELV